METNLFILGALALTAAALAFIFPALRNRRTINADNRAQENILIARGRLAEMESAHTETRGARDEIEAALLDDLTDSPSPPQSKTPSPFSAIAIAILIPIISAALYLSLGNPAALSPAPSSPPSLQAIITKLEQRLQDNPTDESALWLSALAAEAVGDYARALEYLSRLPPEATDNPRAQELIARLRNLLGENN